jgi:hypothetical protein
VNNQHRTLLDSATIGERQCRQQNITELVSHFGYSLS